MTRDRAQQRSPRAVVETYLRCLERRDLAGLDEVVSEDLLVLRPDGTAAFTDRAAWKEALAAEPFDDESIEIEDGVCEGEKVVVRYRLECVHAREALGVPPTGKRITTSGTKIYRVRDGKIVEIAGHDDVLGVLRQLGIVDLEL